MQEAPDIRLANPSSCDDIARDHSPNGMRLLTNGKIRTHERKIPNKTWVDNRPSAFQSRHLRFPTAAVPPL